MDSAAIKAMNTPTLRSEIAKTEAKVLSIQRSKDHHKQRNVLSALQRTLHAMKQELKQRDTEEKRSRYNGFVPHAITPSAR